MKRQSKIGHVRTHYTVIPTRLDIYHTKKKLVMITEKQQSTDMSFKS